jgi:hypothetical protein
MGKLAVMAALGAGMALASSTNMVGLGDLPNVRAPMPTKGPGRANKATKRKRKAQHEARKKNRRSRK